MFFFVFVFNVFGISLIGFCFFWNIYDSDDNCKRDEVDIMSLLGVCLNLVYLILGVF